MTQFNDAYSVARPQRIKVFDNSTLPADVTPLPVICCFSSARTTSAMLIWIASETAIWYWTWIRYSFWPKTALYYTALIPLILCPELRGVIAPLNIIWNNQIWIEASVGQILGNDVSCNGLMRNLYYAPRIGGEYWGRQAGELDGRPFEVILIGWLSRFIFVYLCTMFMT